MLPIESGASVSTPRGAVAGVSRDRGAPAGGERETVDCFSEEVSAADDEHVKILFVTSVTNEVDGPDKEGARKDVMRRFFNRVIRPVRAGGFSVFHSIV